QAKLLHEICAVALDGADADRESLGNLGVGVALGRQVKHVSLPARQGLVALRRAGRRPPLDHLPFPRSLCDGKVMIPCYVENLGRSAHDERIAAQDDQGFPSEGVVERSFVLVKTPPLLSVEPEGVPSGSHAGVAASRGLLEFLVPYAGDSRARELASVKIPLPAGYNLDAPVRQVSISVGQMLAQRPLGLRLGQGLR